MVHGCVGIYEERNQETRLLVVWATLTVNQTIGLDVN
jgi:hypothetical protein